MRTFHLGGPGVHRSETSGRQDAGVPSLDPAAVAALAKVELHCHLEGTMRATIAADLARRHRVTLPVDDPTDLYR